MMKFVTKKQLKREITILNSLLEGEKKSVKSTRRYNDKLIDEVYSLNMKLEYDNSLIETLRKSLEKAKEDNATLRKKVGKLAGSKGGYFKQLKIVREELAITKEEANKIIVELNKKLNLEKNRKSASEVKAYGELKHENRK